MDGEVLMNNLVFPNVKTVCYWEFNDGRKKIDEKLSKEEMLEVIDGLLFEIYKKQETINGLTGIWTR